MKQHRAWQLRVSRTQLSTGTFEQAWVSPHDTTKFRFTGSCDDATSLRGGRYMTAGDGATTDSREEERLRRAIDRTPRRPTALRFTRTNRDAMKYSPAM